MAQGRSWLAETAKICKSGPSVAMVTGLILPSGSVRVSHNELELLVCEPKSLWTLTGPHFFSSVSLPLVLKWIYRIQIYDLICFRKEEFKVQSRLISGEWHKSTSLSRPIFLQNSKWCHLPRLCTRRRCSLELSRIVHRSKIHTKVPYCHWVGVNQS